MKSKFRIIEVTENGEVHYEIEERIPLLFGFSHWQGYGSEYANFKYKTNGKAESVIDKVVRDRGNASRTIISYK